MTAPFSHVDSPTFMGSWPLIPPYVSGSPYLLPQTLLTQARILGVVREPAAGYDVYGRSFDLDVDSTVYTVSFPGTSNLTLAQVITEINDNSGIPGDVAFDENGFLLLKSTLAGEGSYLKVITDDASSPTDVLVNLGLFSGVESFGGGLKPAAHIDPTRQVVFPGQLAAAKGENLSDEIINRGMFQLSLNTDRVYGLLERKKLAEMTSTTVVNPGGGFTISDSVYTGENATPTEDQLENIVTVLGSDGREWVKEDYVIQGSEVDNFIFETDAETGNQKVTAPSSFFSATDDEGEVYILSNDAGMGALQGEYLKITQYVSATVAYVRNMVPSTGVKVAIDDADVDGVGRYVLTTSHVRVVDLWDGVGMSQRVTNYVYVKSSGTTTRVEKTNRIVAVGETFVTDGVLVGDPVTLASHTSDDPFNNDGTYRVGAVIDEETLELVTNDYGPAFLNPIGTPGTYSVSSDGDFYQDPYVELSTTLPAGTYIVKYKKQSTFKDITDTVGALASGSLRYEQEAEDTLQQAVLTMMGPSINNFDEYLYGDRRNNLEDLYYQIGSEHYRHDETGPDTVVAHAGRHRDIRPDNIDMFPGETGETFTLRWENAEGLTTPKMRLVNEDASSWSFELQRGGDLTVTIDSGVARHTILDSAGGIDILGTGTRTIAMDATGTSGKSNVTLKGADNATSSAVSYGAGDVNLELQGASEGTPDRYEFTVRPNPSAAPGFLMLIAAGTNSQVWSSEKSRIGFGLHEPEQRLHVLGRESIASEDESATLFIESGIDTSDPVPRLKFGRFDGPYASRAASGNTSVGEQLGEVLFAGWDDTGNEFRPGALIKATAAGSAATNGVASILDFHVSKIGSAPPTKCMQLSEIGTLTLDNATDGDESVITHTMRALELVSHNMSNADLFMPIVWQSTDTNLSTNNPSTMAAIAARAKETIAADDDGATSLVFYVRGTGHTGVPGEELEILDGLVNAKNNLGLTPRNTGTSFDPSTIIGNGEIYTNSLSDQAYHYGKTGRFQAIDTLVHGPGVRTKFDWTDNTNPYSFGSFTIPAYTLRTGSIIKIKAWGEFIHDSGGGGTNYTVDVHLSFDGTLVSDHQVGGTSLIGFPRWWSLESIIVLDTDGSGGSGTAQARTHNVSVESQNGIGGGGIFSGSDGWVDVATVTSIDTTGNVVIDLGFQYSAGDSDNDVWLNGFFIEII